MPLDDIIAGGTPAQIEAAIKNGADARLKNGEGKRAIDYANAALKELPVYQTLLKAGNQTHCRLKMMQQALWH